MHTKEVHRQSPGAALRWLSARRLFSPSWKHKIPSIDTKHRIANHLTFCCREFPPRSPASPPQGRFPGASSRNPGAHLALRRSTNCGACGVGVPLSGRPMRRRVFFARLIVISRLTSRNHGASMSSVFPNCPEHSQKIHFPLIQGRWQDTSLVPPIPVVPLPFGSPPHRKAKRINRQLTPAKIGVAWEKVRRVVRDLCRQRGLECPNCRLYGGKIEFQLTAGHRPITLDLDGNCIVARIGRRRWTIRIVRIKTGGSGYELRRRIHTVTSMLIELLLEAR